MLHVLKTKQHFQLCDSIKSACKPCSPCKLVHDSGTILGQSKQILLSFQARCNHFLTLPGCLCHSNIFSSSTVGPLITGTGIPVYPGSSPYEVLYWGATAQPSDALPDGVSTGRPVTIRRGTAQLSHSGRKAVPCPRGRLGNTCATEAARAWAFLPASLGGSERSAHSSDTHWVTGRGPPLRGAQFSLA